MSGSVPNGYLPWFVRLGGSILTACLAVPGALGAQVADLVISDARVLDVRTGDVRSGATVVVADGWITSVLQSEGQLPEARRIVDADGGLLVPGLVDTHGHLAYVLGDSVSTGGGYITRLNPSADSLTAYRRRYRGAYLPWGVTTVRDAGSTEADLELLSAWRVPTPGFPDFFPSGGALASHEEGRTTFPGHVVVESPDAAREKVRAYHRAGFEHLKLYWRLREPEFRAALEEARMRGMDVTGHVDFHVLGMARALDLGLDSFEHAYTVGIGALSDAEYQALWQQDVPAAYPGRRAGLFHLAVLEAFNQLGPDDPELDVLIGRLAETESTVSTSLHIFAQQVGVAPFVIRTDTPFDDVSGLSKEQQARARRGYELLARSVRAMHEAGVRLVLAPDWAQPGRVALSEMLLLHRAGIPMGEVFRIATLNGARSMGLLDRGVVEPGAKADLLLFHGDPLEDPMALFGARTVVKDGAVLGER